MPPHPLRTMKIGAAIRIALVLLSLYCINAGARNLSTSEMESKAHAGDAKPSYSWVSVINLGH
jgi:hypothetical protein